MSSPIINFRNAHIIIYLHLHALTAIEAANLCNNHVEIDELVLAWKKEKSQAKRRE